MFTISKCEKLYLQISSSIVHKSDLFLELNVHYLSKKQPRTYFLSNLCKSLDIFGNEICHIFEIEKNLPFFFHMIEKTSSWFTKERRVWDLVTEINPNCVGGCR